jgi:ribosomal protein S18 acetylase RimI-like enzyme
MNSSKIKVINAGSEHIPGILEIWPETFDFHRGISRFFVIRQNLQRGLLKKRLLDFMLSKTIRVFVAFNDQEVVGFSVIRIVHTAPEFEKVSFAQVVDIVVTKEQRRKGIGYMLVKEMKNWLIKKRIKKILLNVLSNNNIGLPFWRKQGFKDANVKTLCLEMRD